MLSLIAAAVEDSRMVRSLITATIIALSGAHKTALALDFDCEFAVRSTLVGSNFSTLQSERKQELERYTLTVPPSACAGANQLSAGTYVNALRKWSGETFVQCLEGRITIVERTHSDNLFFITIFSEGAAWVPAKGYSAILSVHMWHQGVPFYRPYTSTGSCRLPPRSDREG